MTDNILNQIKEIVEEHEEYQENNNAYKTKKIYTEAWKYILTQFKKEFYNKEYYLLPLLFFSKYDTSNNESIDNAIKLLIKDGFQTIPNSNIQALKINRSEIMKFTDHNKNNKIKKR